MADINSKATIELHCNGQQVSNTLAQLKQRAFDLQNAIAKAAAAGDKTDLKKLERQLRDTNRQIKQMTSDAEQAEQVLRRMSKATPKELSQTLATLQKQLKDIERGSSAWDAQVARIKAVKEELAKVREELKEDEGALDSFNDAFDRWQNAFILGAAALTGLVMAGRDAVNTYAEMDAEMANTRKFTGMTTTEVERLNEEFKKMDTRTSRQELNQLAQEAGRLGKSSVEDVMGFVRAADKINVALDDLGEGATLTLSKLTNIFGDEDIYGTEESLLKVGSVINELSQNCTASAPYLAQFAQRLAGVGAQAGLTVPQLMAFGAVLDSQGQKVEMSATALSKLITDMFKNTSKIAKATGMDLQEFQAALKRSTNEGLIMLLQRLNELGDMSVLADVFKDMGEDGARATGVLAALAGNIDMVRQQQLAANIAFAEGKSVVQEFDVQNNTVQAGLEKARKRLTELKVELGEKLAPVMRHIISSTTLLLRAMSTIITFIGKHIILLASLTAAIVTYTIAVNAATVANKVWTAVQAAGSAAMRTLQSAALLCRAAFYALTGQTRKATVAMKALNAVTKTNPWVMLATAVAAVGTALVMFANRAKEAVRREEEAKRAAEEYRKSLTDISETAAALAANETAKLEVLYNAAMNEAASKEERLKAAQRIIDQYPEYFEGMTAEDIMLGKAEDGYKRLTEAIINSSRAKAAAAKITENEAQLLELEPKIPQLEDRLAVADSERRTKQEQYNSTRNKRSKSSFANYNSLGVSADNDMGVQGRYNEWQEAENAYNSINMELANTRRMISDINAANAELAEKYGSAKILAELEGNGNDSGGGSGNYEKEAKKLHDARSKELSDWRAAEEALAEMAYYTGAKSYEEYQQALLEIQKQYAGKMLERTDLTDRERAEAQREYAAAEFKQAKAHSARLVKEEEEHNDAQKVIIMQRYADGLMSQEAYNEAIQQLELRHLRNIIGLYAEGSEERRKAQKAYDDAVMADQVKRRQKAETEEKKARDKKAKEIEKVRKSAFTSMDDEYRQEMTLLQEAYLAEIAACKDNAEKRLEIEKAYHIALYAMQVKWMKKGSALARSEMPKGWQAAVDKSVGWLKSDGGQAITRTFETITQGMGDMFSGISDLVQANLEIESAAIQARYTNEVSAAEGNQYKVRQIEEKKEKELAAVKNKASKKQYTMQVIQAIAQTATGAINAYSSAAAIPVVGFVMAPIAAAMAVAAGMLQVAALKKQQQQAAATGYAEGGFTKQGRKNEPAGIVHAGEWVASQELLANPVARPVIDALDYAQRTNTIGALRSEDVVSPATVTTRTAANADTKTTRITVTPAPVTVKQDERLASTLSLLQQRLEEPFVTVNTITGDAGIAKAQEDYERLIRNKTPRSRRQ